MIPIAWTLIDGKSTPELFHTQSMDSRKEALRLFADRLKQLRVKRKLSQEGLAELAGMNRNELLLPSPLLACDYAHHCCLMSMIGWNTRGGPYGDRAIALAGEFDDVWAKGHSFLCRGLARRPSAVRECAV